MKTPHEDARCQPTWTWRHVLAAAFCLVFLSLQIAIPAYQLSALRPARFGWQMWAARRQPSQFFVVTKDGMSRRVDLTTYVGVSRGEMDLTEALPRHLCRVLPEIVAVEIRDPAGRETTSIHSCQ